MWFLFPADPNELSDNEQRDFSEFHSRELQFVPLSPDTTLCGSSSSSWVWEHCYHGTSS